MSQEGFKVRSYPRRKECNYGVDLFTEKRPFIHTDIPDVIDRYDWVILPLIAGSCIYLYFPSASWLPSYMLPTIVTFLAKKIKELSGKREYKFFLSKRSIKFQLLSGKRDEIQFLRGNNFVQFLEQAAPREYYLDKGIDLDNMDSETFVKLLKLDQLVSNGVFERIAKTRERFYYILISLEPNQQQVFTGTSGPVFEELRKNRYDIKLALNVIGDNSENDQNSIGEIRVEVNNMTNIENPPEDISFIPK